MSFALNLVSRGERERDQEHARWHSAQLPRSESPGSSGFLVPGLGRWWDHFLRVGPGLRE